MKDIPWHWTAQEGRVTRMGLRTEVASPGTKYPISVVVDRMGVEESRHPFDITYGLLVTVLGILFTLEKQG